MSHTTTTETIRNRARALIDVQHLAAAERDALNALARARLKAAAAEAKAAARASDLEAARAHYEAAEARTAAAVNEALLAGCAAEQAEKWASTGAEAADADD